jgi:hypothetical protein
VTAFDADGVAVRDALKNKIFGRNSEPKPAPLSVSACYTSEQSGVTELDRHETYLAMYEFTRPLK